MLCVALLICLIIPFSSAAFCEISPPLQEPDGTEFGFIFVPGAQIGLKHNQFYFDEFLSESFHETFVSNYFVKKIRQNERSYVL